MDALTSLRYFTPELILAGGFFTILLLDLIGLGKRLLGFLTLFLLAWAASALFVINRPVWIFSDLYLIDGLAYLFKVMTILMVALPVTAAITSDQIPEKLKGEFYLLMTGIAFLLIVLGSTTNLLMIYLAMESVSITSYILSGLQTFSKRSSEASLKYLLFGSTASAVMLFGFSLLFGLTGTLELTAMPLTIAKGGMPSIYGGLAALFFILVGFGFKMTMVPFHMWAPDVYEGAPTPVTAFLTVAPKSLGFLVLFRILLIVFPFLYGRWSEMLMWFSILTMTVGNVVAVSQTNVKRILAYSSIAQAGYILMGLAVSNELGKEGIFIYLIAYLFTNLGAFLTLGIVEQHEKTTGLEVFEGLASRNPALALFFTIFLLSLAGIPPLAGFIAKWYVFGSAIQGGFILLAVAAAINSAIAAYYYFKIIRAMYLTSPQREGSVACSGFALTAVWISLAGTVAIGLFPSPVITFVHNVLLNFRMV